MRSDGPDFDFDLAYGKTGERVAETAARWFALGDPRIEVKRKRRYDDDLYVELEADKGATGQRWEPSGLATTRAHLWAFVVADTGIVLFFPTSLLRWAIENGAGREADSKGGSCPTRGRLLRVSWLIQVTFRWQQAVGKTSEES